MKNIRRWYLVPLLILGSLLGCTAHSDLHGGSSELSSTRVEESPTITESRLTYTVDPPESVPSSESDEYRIIIFIPAQESAPCSSPPASGSPSALPSPPSPSSVPTPAATPSPNSPPPPPPQP